MKSQKEGKTMKTKSKLILAAAVCSAAFALPAQQALVPAQAPADAVKAAAETAKPASLAELLAFLPDVVGSAEGITITKSAVIQRLQDMNVPVAEIAKFPKEQFKMILKRMVENMLVEKMMLKKAADAGFKNDEASVKASILKQFGELPKEQQEQILKSTKKTADEIAADGAKNATQRDYMALQGYMGSLYEKEVAKITDDQTLKFYNDNKEKEFKKPETRTVSHILIMANGKDAEGKALSAEDAKKQDADAQAKIKEIKARLDKGEDFGKLAEEFSVCPSGKQSKGQLPEFRRGQMVPEFEKTAFGMTQEGAVSEPVKTMFGYHLIKLHKAGNGGYVSYDDNLKGVIKNAIAQQAMQKQIMDDMEAAKNNGSFKIFGFDAPAAAPAVK